ncbi:MAG TPA: hypothetical protein VF737_08560 [Gemmatimonadaceae bacterium]
MKRLLIALLLAASAAALPAQQVGYAPSRSPYRDVDHTMEFAVLGGHFSATPDPAGVAPQSGQLWSLLYGWHATGPLFLTGSVSRIASVRHVIDPLALNRDRGTESWPLYAFEGGMGLSLTGDRTFHGFMPIANFGMGLISDRHTNSDVGEYQFGTKFEFVWGASIRYIPSKRWGIRADLNNRFYSMGYPQTYYLIGKDGNSVVNARLSKSFWRNNPSLSIGISYLFSH